MPCFVQMVWRECPAPVLQLPAGWANGRHVQLHMRLLWRPSALFEIAVQAGRGDIFPACNAAQTARDNVIEGQIVA